MKRIGILMLAFFTGFAFVAWTHARAQIVTFDGPGAGTAGAITGHDPGKLGPFAIGHTSYMLTDAGNGNRPEYFMVWYPVNPSTVTNSTPPAQYPLDPYSTYLPVSTSTDWQAVGNYDPAYEGPTPSRDGPFPLLVVSPAFSGDAWMYIFIGTRLASHGYVVAAAEPYADCQWSWSPCDDLVTVMVNRPRDVSFIITQLVAKTSTAGELLFHTIDPGRIAISGHSIGGYTSYALTGGDDLVCDALWPVVYGQDTLPYPPSTCVPTLPDRRIKAMISLDGSSQLMRFRELARISVPSLIMGETVDNSQELGELSHPGGGPALRDWIARPHAAINGFDSYRVDVDGSNHYSYTDYCDGAQVFFDLGLISSDALAGWLSSWPCANTGLDAVTISSVDEHEAVTKYMIAFLDVYFAKAESERSVLTPGYASTHTPTVQFVKAEHCDAVLPDDSYFTYRPYQDSDECDIAQKNPTGWFASQSSSSKSDSTLRMPAAGVENLRPRKPF